MPAPLSKQTRDAVLQDLTAGELGRNAIARKHHVSAGYVTKIAREEGHWFDNDWRTSTGTEAHRIDCAAARLDREEQLMHDLLALPQTNRQRDGKETRAHKRLSYKLYDNNRHHN